MFINGPHHELLSFPSGFTQAQPYEQSDSYITVSKLGGPEDLPLSNSLSVFLLFLHPGRGYRKESVVTSKGCKDSLAVSEVLFLHVPRL